MFYQIESPPTKRFIDLALVIPAFVEQKPQIWIPLSPRQAKIHQKIEVGEGPCGDRVTFRNRGGSLLDTNGMNGRPSARFENGGAQEGRLLVVAFNEMYPSITGLRQQNARHNTGKTAATAEIDPIPRAGMKRNDLCAVHHMPAPNLGNC